MFDEFVASLVAIAMAIQQIQYVYEMFVGF